LTWIYSGRPLAYYNGVFRTAITTSDPDTTIAALLAYFRERQQSMVWWVTPATRPLDMPQRLIAHGLTHHLHDIGMAIDVQRLNEAQPLPEGLAIERVDDETGIRDWMAAFALGFGLTAPVAASYAGLVQSVPPAQHPLNPFYLARLHGAPVGTAALFEAAGVAWVTEVAVAPAARRQGIGAAVTLAALRDARDRGYRIGVLQSTAMGEPVYRRVGFTPFCALDGYSWRP
jgi:GNAT superfamily N-acetyltransferase